MASELQIFLREDLQEQETESPVGSHKNPRVFLTVCSQVSERSSPFLKQWLEPGSGLILSDRWVPWFHLWEHWGAQIGGPWFLTGRHSGKQPVSTTQWTSLITIISSGKIPEKEFLLKKLIQPFLWAQTQILWDKRWEGTVLGKCWDGSVWACPGAPLGAGGLRARPVSWLCCCPWAFWQLLSHL